jgi:CarD family transcriptional regulator
MSKNGHDFSVGDHVVYPAHGVGQVQGIETQEVAGLKLEVYVITFDHEKMTLRVPTAKAKTAGLRPLAEGNVVSKALTTLKGRARVKRTMWSRRAQEYEAKINSGDLISIAEVVRDLHRAENQPEQSYSERQLYESALDRMAREVAAIERIDRDAAIGILNKSLIKAVAASSAGLGPRRGPLASAASISLIASVSVTFCTAAISRDSRSSAAS